MKNLAFITLAAAIMSGCAQVSPKSIAMTTATRPPVVAHSPMITTAITPSPSTKDACAAMLGQASAFFRSAAGYDKADATRCASKNGLASASCWRSMANNIRDLDIPGLRNILRSEVMCPAVEKRPMEIIVQYLQMAQKLASQCSATGTDTCIGSPRAMRVEQAKKAADAAIN
jgi:hypothetical protein